MVANPALSAIGVVINSPKSFGRITEDFLIVTSAGRVADLRARIDARFAGSMDYFYPLKDRLAASPMRDPLCVSLGVVTAAESTAEDVDKLKVAILRSRS